MSRTKQKKKPDKKKGGKKAKMPKAVSGVIRNGVVVLENGVAFVEGQQVLVEAMTEKKAGKHVALPDFSDLAVDAGVADLSTNLDHYLYGHPKVCDAR